MSRIYNNNSSTQKSTYSTKQSTKLAAIASVFNSDQLPSTSTSSASSSSFSSPQHEAKPLQQQQQQEIIETKMSATTELNNLVNRLQSVTERLEKLSSSSTLSNGHQQTNGTTQSNDSSSFDALTEEPSVIAFNDIINNNFKSFKELSNKIGGDVVTITSLVDNVFVKCRQFLTEASCSVKPSSDMLAEYFKKYSTDIASVHAFRDKSRKSEHFNHLSAMSEAINAFGWISVEPTPCPYIKESTESAQFYTNRVLKEFKEKDATHVTWVKSWLQVMNDLWAFVKQYHTTGVTWNSAKKSLKFDTNRAYNGGSAPPAPAGGGPLPPPPPPMPNFNDLLSDDTKPNNSNNNNKKPALSTDQLFADINKGGDITSMLKKVSDDQKTHKNPNLRGSGHVPATTTTANKLESTKPINKNITSASSSKVIHDPVFELVDKKWKIEFQNGRHDIVVDQTDLKHTVYIYKCKETTITVKGKVNSILIDSCNRVGLLFDDVLSTVEFINSSSVQMQALGIVPTVTIEKTDGCQVFLNSKTLDTEIISSKSTAMNVLVPSKEDDGEFNELPVPEQFKTVVTKDRKLKTMQTEMV